MRAVIILFSGLIGSILATAAIWSGVSPGRVLGIVIVAIALTMACERRMA